MLKLVLLILGVLITASVQQITVPLFVSIYPSIYFLSVIITVECLVLYTVALTILNYISNKKLNSAPKCTKKCTTLADPTIISKLPLVSLVGVSNAAMSMCFLYSANPIRTPILIQTIFLGLAILPSVLFTKVILNKNNKYEKKYCIPSIIFMVISICLAIIPFVQYNINFSAWILMYLGGVILMSLTNILQEKYTNETKGDNEKFIDKIRLAFYSRIFHTIFILCMCWMDIVFGYNDDGIAGAVNAFIESFNIYIGDLYYFFIIQVFVFSYFLLFIIAMYLNEISTNYNMVTTGLSNQSVTIFFTIFPHLNHGIKYPIFVVILNLYCNIASIFLWVKGETDESDMPSGSEKIKLRMYAPLTQCNTNHHHTDHTNCTHDQEHHHEHQTYKTFDSPV